jgi:energy-coupling factor transporter ATP-binding protein EcfA2
MTLLELRGIDKYRAYGSRRVPVLRDVSLELDAGELVAVWGLPGSGRSTLLAIAAGIDPPDAGTVRFEGRDLAGRGAAVLGGGIGYCRPDVVAAGGRKVVDHVRAGLLARGVSARVVRSRVERALHRVGFERFDGLVLSDLDAGETVRVALASALVLGPRLLVVDEPTKGVDLLARDGIVLLLRALANEGTAVLVSDGDGSGLSDADRALALAAGELRGRRSPQLATVLPLRRVAGKSTAA